MEDASTDTSSMHRLAVILNRATTVVSFCQQVLLVAAVAIITARDGYAMLHAEPGYPSLQSGKSSSVIPLSIIVSIIISAGTLCSSIVMKAALNLSLPDWRSMCIQLPSRSLMYVLAFSLGFVGTDWAHSRGMIVFPTLIHCCVHAFLVSITSLCVWRARVSSAGAVSLRNPLLNFTGPTWAAGDDAHRQIFASDVESKVSDDSADSVTSSGRHGGRGKTRDEAAQRYKDVLTEAAAVARQGAVEAEGKGTRTTIHRRGQFSQSAPAVESSGEEANTDTDPSVWVSAIDQRSGNVYYSNRSTGEVSWSPPEGFVEVTDWIQLVSANGRPYFYSASLNKTVWRQPPGYRPHVSLPGEVSSSEAAESVSVPVGPAGLEPMGDMTGRKRVHFGDTLQASIEMIDQRLKSRTSAVDDSSVAAADVDPPVSDYTTPSDSAAPANAAEDVVVESGVTSMMSEARQRAQVAAAADPSGKGKDKAFFAEMKRAKEEEAKRKAEEKLAAMTSEERAEHERWPCVS